MKKLMITLSAALSLMLSVTACGKETPLLRAADYELNLENNTTSKGIGIGDTPEAFIEAYGSYVIETSVSYGPYQPLDAEEIPFEEPVKTILPTFFIDGLPVTIEQICTENEIERTDLLVLLSSEEYLQNHTVMYHYMVFNWENGVITDIRSEFMDYNEDASYYEELETNQDISPQGASEQ